MAGGIDIGSKVQSAAVAYTPAELGARLNIALNNRAERLLRDLENNVVNGRYAAHSRQQTLEVTGYEGVQVYEEDDMVYIQDSYFGGSLPVWLPLLLGKTGDISEDLLLSNAIVTVSQSRNIVTTAIQGRDGTVKEFISNGDYELQVTGALAVPGYRFPKELINELRAFMELRQPIPVFSSYINSMGIYEVVVTEWSLPANNAAINARPYKFTALSTRPVELLIDDEA